MAKRPDKFGAGVPRRVGTARRITVRRQAGLAATTNGSLGQGCRPRPRWRADS
jgi:hypothetical protein